MPILGWLERVSGIWAFARSGRRFGGFWAMGLRIGEAVGGGKVLCQLVCVLRCGRAVRAVRAVSSSTILAGSGIGMGDQEA